MTDYVPQWLWCETCKVLVEGGLTRKDHLAPDHKVFSYPTPSARLIRPPKQIPMCDCLKVQGLHQHIDGYCTGKAL